MPGPIPSLACKQILSALKEAGKPLKMSEITRLTGLSEKQVTASVEHLVKQGSITGTSYFSVTNPSAIGRRV